MSKIEKELKTFNDIEKKNNFKVPENYFEDFEEKILNKIKNKELSKKPSPYQIFKPYLYMAASVILLAYGIRTILTYTVDTPKRTTLIETETSNYDFDDMVSELTSDDLAMYEYLNDDNNENYFAQNLFIQNDEDLLFLEDYLSQYYIEYELGTP